MKTNKKAKKLNKKLKIRIRDLEKNKNIKIYPNSKKLFENLGV